MKFYTRFTTGEKVSVGEVNRLHDSRVFEDAMPLICDDPEGAIWQVTLLDDPPGKLYPTTSSDYIVDDIHLPTNDEYIRAFKQLVTNNAKLELDRRAFGNDFAAVEYLLQLREDVGKIGKLVGRLQLRVHRRRSAALEKQCDEHNKDKGLVK
jgi:hypothetical protein